MGKQTFTGILGIGIVAALAAATIMAVGGDIPRGGPIADWVLAIGIMAYLPPTLRMLIQWIKPESNLLVDYGWSAQSDAIAATASTGYFAAQRAHRETFAGLAARGAIGRDLCATQQTRAQPSARRAGRQTGGSGTATRQASGSKSADDDGGDGDPDGDPDPATDTHPNPRPSPDPDPDDCIISDPHVNPESTPENRRLRKAILARRNPPKTPTKAYVKAHDYYVAHALRDIERAMQHIVGHKHTLTQRDMDHIPPAAHRLFARLADAHDFERRPNPVVRGSTGLVACIAFRDSEGLDKYARGGPYAPSAESRKADIRLGRAMGLYPRGEKSWVDAMVKVDHHLDHTAASSVDVDVPDYDPLQLMLAREDQENPGKTPITLPHTLVGVLGLIAVLSLGELASRAPAIFSAMSCMAGCDTVQHRVQRLQTVIRNCRAQHAPEVVRAAQILLDLRRSDAA